MKWKCQDHPFQPLDYVCLDPSCQKRKTLCFLCRMEIHNGHESIINLRTFIDDFLSVKTASDNLTSPIAQIDQELIGIQHGLSKLKNKLFNCTVIMEAFNNFWKETAEEIVKFSRIVDELSSIVASGDLRSLTELNIWIEKYSKWYQIEEDEENESQPPLYNRFLIEKHLSLKTLRETIDSFRQKSSFDDSEILELFHIKEVSWGKLKLHFSQDLKGECMKIESPTRITMFKSGNQRMVLLEPALSNSRSIKKWKVKIEKLASWIGVGVAHLDSIKGVNFDFSYTNSNHGNYLISSNGYSWNGFKMDFNSKFEPFAFKTGDIVEVTYDPPGCKITFAKQGEEKTFTYEIDPNQKPIHAAINLTGLGDTVEILQK